MARIRMLGKAGDLLPARDTGPARHGAGDPRATAGRRRRWPSSSPISARGLPPWIATSAGRCGAASARSAPMTTRSARPGAAPRGKPSAARDPPPMRPFWQNNFRRQIQLNQRFARVRAFRRDTIALAANVASPRIPRPRHIPRKFWQNNFRRKPQRDQCRAISPEGHAGLWVKPP